MQSSVTTQHILMQLYKYLDQFVVSVYSTSHKLVVIQYVCKIVLPIKMLFIVHNFFAQVGNPGQKPST